MKKKMILLTALCFIVIVAISSFFIIREINYNYTKEQGYLIGYSIAHTDKVNGAKHNSNNTNTH